MQTPQPSTPPLRGRTVLVGAPPPPSITPLTYPAPRREWYRTESGGWASRPWTVAGTLRTCASGGYFHLGRGIHDFEDNAAIFARDAMELFELLQSIPPRRIPPDFITSGDPEGTSLLQD